MSPLSSTFPCEENDIMAEHENCMKEAIQVFRQETLMDPDVENFKENLKEFTVKTPHKPQKRSHTKNTG